MKQTAMVQHICLQNFMKIMTSTQKNGKQGWNMKVHIIKFTGRRRTGRSLCTKTAVLENYLLKQGNYGTPWQLSLVNVQARRVPQRISCKLNSLWNTLTRKSPQTAWHQGIQSRLHSRHDKNGLLVNWVIKMNIEVSCENQFMRGSEDMSNKR